MADPTIMPVSLSQLHTLRQVQLYLSAAGVVLLTPVLLTNLCYAERRRFPARISTCFIANVILYRQDHPPHLPALPPQPLR